ncbi:hypothetical protein G9E11_08115 [Arthrobacter sp. IA7]|uniref:hypothetical protein n=1 Tax=Arthrobacter ipis TaxID=2716202 RepID=UPI001687FD8A|nr:hypothetical protein [Arthrobacter ipis]MBD1542210.1 hypothetical protein [Arthrobacter ipis]
MGNSGKTAIGAYCAAAGLLVLTAVTLEEAALVALLGAVAVGYVATVAEAFARHRYLALLAGGVGTSLSIGCSIAFLRTWGLAFNQGPATLGPAVTTRDSDIYFYLAAASGCLTLLVLFCAAVWPSRRRLRRKELARPAGTARRTATATARPGSAGPARSAGSARAGRTATATARPGSAGPARSAGSARAAGAQPRPAARLPAGARQSAQGPVRQQPVRQQPVRQQPAQRTDGKTSRR